MNPADAMERIESPRFSAAVNVASDLRTFLRALAAQPEVQALAGALPSSEVAARILVRTRELAAQPAVEGYEHLADAALAAYLWLLHRRHPEAAQTAAQLVRGCRRLWWARQVLDAVAEQGAPPASAGAPQESSRNGGPNPAGSEAHRTAQ